MNKAHKIIAHLSFYVYEMEPTGEVGKLVNKSLDIDVQNKIISYPPCSKEEAGPIISSIISKVVEHARKDD